MTNPEQTIRERLAEVRFRRMKGVTDDDVLRAEPILVQEHVYEEVDLYLEAVREWLEMVGRVRRTTDSELADAAILKALGGQHD